MSHLSHIALAVKSIERHCVLLSNKRTNEKLGAVMSTKQTRNLELLGKFIVKMHDGQCSSHFEYDNAEIMSWYSESTAIYALREIQNTLQRFTTLHTFIPDRGRYANSLYGGGEYRLMNKHFTIEVHIKYEEKTGYTIRLTNMKDVPKVKPIKPTTDEDGKFTVGVVTFKGPRDAGNQLGVSVNTIKAFENRVGLINTPSKRNTKTLAKPVSVAGLLFSSITDASVNLDVNVNTITLRCKSKNWPHWSFVTQQ